MKHTYYLFNPGRLSRKDNTLKFTPIDENGVEHTPRYLPVEQVEELFVFGSLDANSALYNFMGKNNISVHFFDYYENYTGSFSPKNSILSGKMLIEQTKSYLDKKKRLRIAQQFVEGASFNILKNLKYYDNRGKDMLPIIEEISILRERIPKVLSVSELMGIEGNIRKLYYTGFELIIENYSMEGRYMRPPTNIVNCLMSFGNMLCYSDCLRAISQTQLDPTISFLHQPGERRYSLSLDLAEIFKPIIIDRLLFKVLNKRILKDSDFDERLNRVVLKENAKKRFLAAYDERMRETFKHRTLNRKISFKHLIKLECYKLQKDILNIEEYQPFKMYW